MGALVETLSGDGSPRRQRRDNGERTNNMTTTLQYACAMCVVELGPNTVIVTLRLNGLNREINLLSLTNLG